MTGVDDCWVFFSFVVLKTLEADSTPFILSQCWWIQSSSSLRGIEWMAMRQWADSYLCAFRRFRSTSWGKWLFLASSLIFIRKYRREDDPGSRQLLGSLIGESSTCVSDMMGVCSSIILLPLLLGLSFFTFYNFIGKHRAEPDGSRRCKIKQQQQQRNASSANIKY